MTAYPNPFTGRIGFRLEAAVSGQASLDIFNVMGRKIKLPYHGYMQKGETKQLKFIFLMQHSPSCLFFKGIASKAWQFIV
jgi:hypothetical protein